MRDLADPTADLDRFLSEDPGGPVVMINLLRFEPNGGQERYMEYVAHFNRTAAKYGPEVVYVGATTTPLVAEPDQRWDMIAIIRYPSRQALKDMFDDEEYQAGEHLRHEAVTEWVFVPTTPVPTP